jgi:hypothetical protein
MWGFIATPTRRELFNWAKYENFDGANFAVDSHQSRASITSIGASTTLPVYSSDFGCFGVVRSSWSQELVGRALMLDDPS